VILDAVTFLYSAVLKLSVISSPLLLMKYKLPSNCSAKSFINYNPKELECIVYDTKLFPHMGNKNDKFRVNDVEINRKLF
jgi:hypothetical protein